VSSRRDPDHERVLASTASHVVVVAPPGTGKTHLSVRIAADIAKKLTRGQRVLLMTFSNQARAQLERESRQLDLRSESRSAIEITNYHSFFRREVWAYRRALRLPLAARIVPLKSRKARLSVVDPAAVKICAQRTGLLEALAEHSFERFHDPRTPNPEALDRLLAVVRADMRSGELLFDDLGALFWELLETYPTLARAYAARYPVVIADEHQDASALQDAVVRRLGTQRMVVFADPMQLIYGFRGSSLTRLNAHLREAGETFELHTPHRWHGDAPVGEWLLSVRARLAGQHRAGRRPNSLSILEAAYPSVTKFLVRKAVSDAFKSGLESVAVIAAFSRDVFAMRDYLARQGMYPKQIGGGEDFESAHDAMEQLPLLTDSVSLCQYAIDRIGDLVPTLDAKAIHASKARVTMAGIRLDSRCNEDVKAILRPIAQLHRSGPAGYFAAVASALTALASRKHNLPRIEAVRAVTATANALAGSGPDLEAALSTYAAGVAAAAQHSGQIGRGLYVLTAHQSKGKEFDAVVVAHAGAQQFPDDDDGRRLFYVALTRATKSWTVVAPQDSPSVLLKLL
jgi:superfamily I DNA/RNA helicase